MHAKRIYFLATICLFQYSFFSCDSDSPSIPQDMCGSVEGFVGDHSRLLAVRIYLDATLSMLGFTVEKESNYLRSLDYLERVFIEGWQKAEIQYFKFGKEILVIETPRDALSGEFYRDQGITQETRIENVVRHTVADRPDTAVLTVISTDLFQQDADINELTKLIKNRYVQEGLAVGVVGILSQFRGWIYDVGIQAGSFRHEPSDIADTTAFRPFYFLVLGRHQDIAHFFEQLERSLPFIGENSVIFSRHLVPSLTTFESVKPDSIVGMSGFGVMDHRFKWFVVQGDNSNPASFVASSKFGKLKYTTPFKEKDLQSEIVGYQVKDDQWIRLEKPQNHLRFSNIATEDSMLTCSVSFASSGSLIKEAYIFEALIFPDLSAASLPTWVEEWDMAGDNSNGSKTYNLVNFIRGLRNVNYQVHRPKIAKVCCYFEEE